MNQQHDRRTFLAAGVAGAAFLPLPWTRPLARSVSRTGLPDEAGAAAVGMASTPDFPRQDRALVQEMVGVSHGNLERVRELVSLDPELAKAAIDWGFGDWESALGAAAHTGGREIAELLLEHGARPDLFSAAMLGQLEVVRATVRAQPGIQRTSGPHGISLLAHARAGGAPAAAVAEYLEGLGDADRRRQAFMVDDEHGRAVLGTYRFGTGGDEVLEVIESSSGGVRVRRVGGSARQLMLRDEGGYQPVGADSVVVEFELSDGGTAESITIRAAGQRVTGTRTP